MMGLVQGNRFVLGGLIIDGHRVSRMQFNLMVSKS